MKLEAFGDILEKKGRNGDPRNILKNFKEIQQTVDTNDKENGAENSPMQTELEKKNEKKTVTSSDYYKRTNVREEFYKRRRQKCDEVFSEYINYLCEKSNDEYCKIVISFCLLYREWANECSEILEQKKKGLPELINIKELNPMVTSEYCLSNNAELFPEISNEFITKYVINMENINLDDMKELTLHFCVWLFFNCYTCSLISTTPFPIQDEKKKNIIEEPEQKNPPSSQNNIKLELENRGFINYDVDNKQPLFAKNEVPDKKENNINIQGNKPNGIL